MPDEPVEADPRQKPPRAQRQDDGDEGGDEYPGHEDSAKGDLGGKSHSRPLRKSAWFRAASAMSSIIKADRRASRSGGSDRRLRRIRRRTAIRQVRSRRPGSPSPSRRNAAATTRSAETRGSALKAIAARPITKAASMPRRSTAASSLETPESVAASSLVRSAVRVSQACCVQAEGLRPIAARSRRTASCSRRRSPRGSGRRTSAKTSVPQPMAARRAMAPLRKAANSWRPALSGETRLTKNIVKPVAGPAIFGILIASPPTSRKGERISASIAKSDAGGRRRKLQMAAAIAATAAPSRKPTPEATGLGRVAKRPATTAAMTPNEPPEGQAVSVQNAAAARIASAARTPLRIAAIQSMWKWNGIREGGAWGSRKRSEERRVGK